MLRVLIVEDDLSFRELLKETLLIFNYQPTLAVNGEEAQEILSEHSFDVILTDITLGGLTGLELTKWYREKNTETPIIVISGHSDHLHIQDALNAGVNDYITKPFKITELPLIIERNLHPVVK